MNRKTFSKERLIRFSHCDPAGIVYFVNFFDMVGGVVEDWFREAVGLPFHEMHLGDTLALELSIAHLGRSSIEFRVRGSVAGSEKFRARHKVAMVSLDTFRPLAIPDEMRAKMAPYILSA